MHNPRQRLHYIVTKSQILQGRDYEVKIQQFLMMVPRTPLRAYSGGFWRH